MTYYDEQLRDLQEQISRFRQQTAKRRELLNQKNTLQEQVRRLETVMRNEQADVEKLEGHSLAAFYYYVIGKRDERLTAERQEAYAAKVKYDSAAGELEAVAAEIRALDAELLQLRGCEQRYEAVLQAKKSALKEAGSPHAEEILQLEERMAFLESQRKELREAISAGTSAQSTAERVLTSLSRAENWGTVDLLGGGLVSDLAKHSHLDTAQTEIAYLQTQLRRFKTELADIQIHADTQVNVDGFLRFADFFFDGLFADWSVMGKIRNSQDSVSNTLSQVRRVLSRLNSMLRTAEQDYAEAKRKLDVLVLGAQL